MNDERLYPIYGILAFVGVITVIIVIIKLVRYRSHRIEMAETEETKRIDEAIAQGTLGKDVLSGEVYRACVVCKSRATEFMPTSGVSWMDKLPLLNRLHSLAPRYVIINNEAGGFQLCGIHKKVAIRKMERFHALLRAERAQFNSQQEDRVAQMEAGGLRQQIEKQYNETIETLTVKNVPPQLVASTTQPSDNGDNSFVTVITTDTNAP